MAVSPDRVSAILRYDEPRNVTVPKSMGEAIGATFARRELPLIPAQEIEPSKHPLAGVVRGVRGAVSDFGLFLQGY